ncbi:M48 family metalloprotease [Rubrivivax gelatinosus]|uniref:Peptidase M48 domain-containing protein n=1 Tax=Rubrivivax gelatinosus TaxID=28068 RepID=A0ABS1DSS0_RUBGE|nr:M48 family metalloprotease [Rubrivivax gelatinosus]MBK1713064.1 hypothetical protein [Rubrivivax gelatinosus]
MKYGKRAIAATALAAQAVLYTSPAVPATAPKYIAERFDCSAVAGLKLAPGALTVLLVDESAQPAKARLETMRAPACRSVYAAQQVADNGAWLDRDWLGDVIFSAVDARADKPATDLVQSRLRAPHYVVTATTTLVDKTGPDALTFALSREIGHGVYRHGTRTSALRLLSTGLYATSLLSFGMLPTLSASVVASGAAADTGLGLGTCVVAGLNKRFELQADAFGVRSLETLGVAKPLAQRVALGVLRSTPAEESRCMDAQNATAGTFARSQAVLAL